MSRRLSVSTLWLITSTSAAFSSLGCDDALKDEALIQETRVLGARVEVAGDPQRSSPAPGESAHFELFVAAPGGALNVAYALSLCGVSPTNSGFPACASAPFATAFRAQPSSEAPALDFQVPADLNLAQAPHGFASGILCPDSEAVLDADGGAQCASGAGNAVAFEFDFAGPGQDNGNPQFQADSVSLDGLTWANGAPSDCASLSQVHAKTKHTLNVHMQDDDFDMLVPLTSEDPTRETLLLSQFSDAGTLAHTFASLDATTPAGLSSDVSWDAPSATDASGTIARFYFVVRDSRGGEDFTTRALCVVP